MTYEREIEKKFIVESDLTMDEIDTLLEEMFRPWNVLRGVSYDHFWSAPKVDFIRYRVNTEELTFKITDGPSIVNRVEENLLVESSFEKVERWCSAVFGEKVGALRKDYRVFYYEGGVISLYQVDDRPTIYLEVEADNLAEVNSGVGRVRDILNLTQEHRSLFNIIFGEQK